MNTLVSRGVRNSEVLLYLVVKVNCSDVHYHIVVKVNTYKFTLFIVILMW